MDESTRESLPGATTRRFSLARRTRVAVRVSAGNVSSHRIPRAGREHPRLTGLVTERETVTVRDINILDVAPDQVLERGVGLDEAQTLAVLRLPDERIRDALALAHDVRLRWCGPEVEVEGIVAIKTGGCPEDCHFCSQSGRFPTPVRSVRLDIPALAQRRGRPQPRGRPSSASSPLCGALTSDS